MNRRGFLTGLVALPVVSQLPVPVPEPVPVNLIGSGWKVYRSELISVDMNVLEVRFQYRRSDGKQASPLDLSPDFQ